MEMITAVCKVQRLDSWAAKTFLRDERLVSRRKANPEATRQFGSGERKRERERMSWGRVTRNESGSGI